MVFWKWLGESREGTVVVLSFSLELMLTVQGSLFLVGQEKTKSLLSWLKRSDKAEGVDG